MPNVDPELLAALDALKPRHKRWLLEQNLFPVDLATQEEKLEHLASIWGAEQLRQYSGLYREGHGKLFTWWLPSVEAPPLDEIYYQLLERRPGVSAGLRPHLEYGQGPALHKAEKHFDSIEMQYAMTQKPRLLLDGWEERMITPIKIFRSYVKQEPFTVEMRAIQGSHQREILLLMEDDLGVSFGATTPCLLLTDAVQQRLCADMSAMPYGVHQLGNGNANMDYTILTTDRKISILEQDDFCEQLAHAERREYFKWFYVFDVRHPDGYIEECGYIVKVTTGELSISKGISEFAADRLREHVVALF